MANGPIPSAACARLSAYLIICGWVVMVLPTRGQAQCPVDIAKLIASDAAMNDAAGYSVAVDGDTAVIGAYGDDHGAGVNAGAAYIFVQTGGVWSQQAKLTASDAAAADLFGYSVAISGGTVLVGARDDTHAGGASAGSAYVFTKIAGAWSQQAKLTASDAAAGDLFGTSVGISGDTAVIGASFDDLASGVEAGSAYVFSRCGGITWTQQTKLTAFDSAGSDLYGCSVAISGETVVVGSQYDDHAGGSGAGSVYVYTRAGTLWVLQQKLTALIGVVNANLGNSVTISGETIIAGANFETNAGGTNAGAAYAFVRSAGIWTQQAKLTAGDAAGLDHFGTSVSSSGDLAVIGSNDDDHAGGTNAGSAYVFSRVGGVWSEEAKMTASDAAAQDNFGNSVSVNGTTSFVGAHGDDNAGGSEAGSAYVFGLTCDSDEDGVADADDVCPDNDPGLPVDCSGRPLRDCNGDCLVNGDDAQCIVDEMLGL